MLSKTAVLEPEEDIAFEAQPLPPRFYHVCPPARGTVPSPSDTGDKIRCLIREMMQPNPRCSICSTTSAASSSSSTCASNSTSNIVSATSAVAVDVSEVSIAMVTGSTSALSPPPPPLSASADCSVESAASTAVVIDEQDDNDDESERHQEDGFGLDSSQQQEMFPLREGIKWPSHTSILLPETELEKQQHQHQQQEPFEPLKTLIQPFPQKRASRASVHLDKMNDYSHRVARYLPFAKIALVAFLLALIVAFSHLLGYDIYEQKTMIRIGLIWAFFAIYCLCLPTFKRWYKIWEHLPDREIQQRD